MGGEGVDWWVVRGGYRDTVCVRHTFSVRHTHLSRTVSDLHHLPQDHVESEHQVIHLLWVLPSVDAANLPMLPKAKLLVCICSKEMDQVHE